jgi:hypothetical protein
MWAWWMDVLLSLVGVALVGLAAGRIVLDRYTRGMNLD